MWSGRLTTTKDIEFFDLTVTQDGNSYLAI